MPSFVPHTQQEIKSMLEFLGLEDIDELYDHIPVALKLTQSLAITALSSEFDVIDQFTEIGNRNTKDLICFAGYGAYDRLIPAVTKQLASRSEFVTAYTPYQPEVAQGVLQAIFEYQTFVTRLYGMDIANASLYDGASALVEAVNIATSVKGNKSVFVSEGVFHNYRQVLGTFVKGTQTNIIIKTDKELEDFDAFDTSNTVAAVVVQSPNRYGNLVDLDKVKQLCDRLGCLYIVAMDPIAASVLKTPGEAGADIAIGEGQVLGMPLSFGGPYLGLFALKQDLVRKLPGRLVGQTVDTSGKKAYVTTLRSREQDIRREKASSNVCTNQTLMAVTAAIQLSWLGSKGITEVAANSSKAAHYLRSILKSEGFEFYGDDLFLFEFSVKLKQKVDDVLQRMVDEGFLAGVKVLNEIDGQEYLVVATTEKRTASQIDAFVKALVKADN